MSAFLKSFWSTEEQKNEVKHHLICQTSRLCYSSGLHGTDTPPCTDDVTADGSDRMAVEEHIQSIRPDSRQRQQAGAEGGCSEKEESAAV